MAVKIGSNISSLVAQRRLAEATSSLSSTYERLSSGQRINKTSDDAAGLAIAKSLDVNAKIYGQAIRNINDGISVANIAEGALGTLREISQRQLELAEQAANGTYSLLQRQAMNAEANKLVEEYNRIVESTQFNGQRLFGSNPQGVSIQAGIGAFGSLFMSIGQKLSRNVGDGTFQAPVRVSSERLLATGDFNGDGIDDLAGGTANYVNILLANGDGSFGGVLSSASAWVDHLTSADVNADGKLDLITDTAVLLGKGDGTFQPSLTIPTAASNSFTVTGDVNGDGKVDLICSHVGTQSVRTFLGRGDGSFQSGVTVMTGLAWGYGAIGVGDLNGDGKDDVIASNGDSIVVSYAQANGAFSSTQSIFSGLSLVGVAIADVDRDGRKDILAIDDALYKTFVLTGNGNGTFNAARSYGVGPGPNDLRTADLNGDGNTDLVYESSDQGLDVLLGNGDGTFQTRARATPAAFGWLETYGIGDFNGDQRPDLVAWDSDFGESNFFFGRGSAEATTPYLNLCTRQDAYDAMPVINSTLQRIQNELGSIGSVTSRFAVALNTLSTTRENSLAAASRITDADMGQEAANLTRTQIVQQAAAAVLAQANQEPELALRLLRITI